MRRTLAILALASALGNSPALALEIKQGSTATKVPFLLLSSTDHVTPVTGVTPTVAISKNGATFAAPAGTVAELGNGWYVLTPATADTGTTGDLIVHATGTGADPADRIAEVVAYDPTSSANLGLTSLPASGTLAVKPAVTLAGSDVSGVVPANTTQLAGQAVTAASGVTFPSSVSNYSGGAVSSVTGNVGGNVTGSVGSVVGSVAQTGDAFARIGANGVGLTAVGDTRLGTLTTLAGMISGSAYTAPALALAPSGTGASAASIRAEMDANSTKLANLTGPAALQSQIPASFTPALFASPGVFATGALVNAPSGGGGGASYIPLGTVVQGSTTTSVIVSGLTADKTFTGQHLYHQSGESRLIGSQSYANGNYTFGIVASATLPAAFSSITAGETVKPTP